MNVDPSTALLGGYRKFFLFSPAHGHSCERTRKCVVASETDHGSWRRHRARRKRVRGAPGAIADTSLSGTRVARELDRLMIERGKPKMVVSDNASELTSNAWRDRAYPWWFSCPGFRQNFLSTISIALSRTGGAGTPTV